MRRTVALWLALLLLAAPVSAQIAAPIVAGPLVLQNAATTGNGRILYIGGRSVELTLVIQASASCMAGVIKLEEAYYTPQQGPEYSGTWSVINTFTQGSEWDSSSQTIYHSPAPAAFWAVRARISTTVTGCTVTVTAWAN